MSFYDRYAECCVRKGIAPVSQESADKIGCTRGAISAFAKSGATPKGNLVAGAALMLNTSADYFLGLIDYPRPLYDNNELSAAERQVLQLIQSLNEEGMVAAIAVLSGLSAHNTFKKCSSADLDTKTC